MWTPYDNLIHYATPKAIQFGGSESAHIRAIGIADFMAKQALRSELIAVNHTWAPSNVTKAKPISSQLGSFLFRKAHRSRQVLERLLLAYFTMGLDVAEACLLAHKDYEELGDWRLRLSLRDTVQFAYYFWNWSNTKVDVSSQESYAERHLSNMEIGIYRGAVSLRDVQVDSDLPTNVNAGKTLQKVADLMMLTTEKEMRRLYQKGNIFAHPGAFGAMSGFASAMGAVVKGAADMSASTGSTETLNDFIEAQYDTIDESVMSWSAQEALGLTWEDLAEENAQAAEMRAQQNQNDD